MADRDGAKPPAGDATVTSGEPAVAVVVVAAPTPGPEPGKPWARYQVLEPLGQGGMGSVHAARDRELDREVALKVMHDEHLGRASQERLRREARAMARVAHPNVVPVYDVGEHHGRTYYTMERVRGESVKDWLRQPRPWREVQRVFLDAARGLAAIHAAGLVHRDVKPGNLLLGDDGRARVADLGIALGDPTVPGGTPLGATTTLRNAGTPAYMAPEQLRGEAGDARSDQYAFGVALFEALHGRRPDAAEDAATSDVPGWLAEVVRRTRAADPAARFPDMPAVVRALAGPTTRRRWPWLLAAATALAGAGALVLGSGPGPAPPSVPPTIPAGRADLASTRALTDVGADACADAPGFVDAATVGFDLDRGGAVTPQQIALAGGRPTPLTAGALATWRARPAPPNATGGLPGARAAVGTGAVYVATATGIVRRDHGGAETTLVPGVLATGGVAIAPDGAALVYSTCGVHADLLDVTAVPPRRLVDQPGRDPTFGPHGALAWSQLAGDVALLHVRLPDGRLLQLTRPALGSVGPAAFSTSGHKVAFAVARGPAPGLYVVDVEGGATTNQVTSDARDAGPVFTPDDQLAFTRTGADGVARPVLLDPDTGTVSPLGTGAGVVAGVRADTGELLLHGATLSWFDPKTRHARPGPIVAGAEVHLSPAGSWLVFRTGAGELWRQRLEPPGAPERIAAGPTSPGAAIDDDGRVALSAERRSGDLYVVASAAGSRF